MNASIILDSSAVISLFYSDDSNHSKALEISKIIVTTGANIVFPKEILVETLNVIGKKRTHQEAISLGKNILSSPEYILVEASPAMFHEALVLLEQQPSTVSFTDCLVMSYAHEYHTKCIFGFDEVFAKNGYQLPE